MRYSSLRPVLTICAAKSACRVALAILLVSYVMLISPAQAEVKESIYATRNIFSPQTVRQLLKFADEPSKSTYPLKAAVNYSNNSILELDTPDGRVSLNLTPSRILSNEFILARTNSKGFTAEDGTLHLYHVSATTHESLIESNQAGFLYVTKKKDELKVSGSFYANDHRYRIQSYNQLDKLLIDVERRQLDVVGSSSQLSSQVELFQEIISSHVLHDDYIVPPKELSSPPELIDGPTTMAALDPNVELVAEIAIDIDYPYAQRIASSEGQLVFGDGVKPEELVLEAFAFVDKLYHAQVGIRFELVYLHVWEIPDPYSDADTIGSFADYFERNVRPTVSYDLAHLITDKDKPGIGGRASLGAVCNSAAYGWSHLNAAPRFFEGHKLFNSDALEYFFRYGGYSTIAHELGHNFGADHITDDGPYIMLSSSVHSSLFSDATKKNIRNFASGLSCLDTSVSNYKPYRPIIAKNLSYSGTSEPLLIRVGRHSEIGQLIIMDPEGATLAKDYRIEVTSNTPGAEIVSDPLSSPSAPTKRLEYTPPRGAFTNCAEVVPIEVTVTDPDGLQGSTIVPVIVENRNLDYTLVADTPRRFSNVKTTDTVTFRFHVEDPNDCGVPVYKILFQTPTNAFTINEATGEVTWGSVTGATIEEDTNYFAIVAVRPNGAEIDINPIRLLVNTKSNSSPSDSSSDWDDFDSDNDGINNITEQEDGSDPYDGGSFYKRVSSPAYSLWNGFLDMVNILETVNSGESSSEISVEIFDISGALANTISFPLEAGERRDIILNDLEGFKNDSYGLIVTSFTGDIDGKLLYYRPTTSSFSEFDFAFALPFVNPSTGSSSVGFNTFQPSYNPEESRDIVANWLSIVNLASVPKRFIVFMQDQNGNYLGEREVSVGPFARLDLEGGHVSPGPGKVGMHEIFPLDANSPYFAFLIRYGLSDSGNVQFAFPLISKKGTGQPVFVPISATQSQNWVEVLNTREFANETLLRFFRSDGSVVAEISTLIQPFAQQHFDALKYLPAGDAGYVEIIPSQTSSILAQSMHYENLPKGSIDALWGIQSIEPFGDKLTGAYNLFLSMENILRLTNTSNVKQFISVDLNGLNNFHANKSLELSPNSSVELPLHEHSLFSTLSDTYGIVSVTSSDSRTLIANILRRKYSAHRGQYDFVAPTQVR